MIIQSAFHIFLKITNAHRCIHSTSTKYNKWCLSFYLTILLVVKHRWISNLTVCNSKLFNNIFPWRHTIDLKINRKLLILRKNARELLYKIKPCI